MSNLEIKSSSGDTATKLVVLLHGLGSDGQDLLGLVPYFSPSFPNWHFYSPNGIEPCDMSPYGYQWFSLQNRDPHIIAKEIERVAPQILDIIEQKLNELKLTFEDLIIIGFSQGTMLGLYLTHAFDFKIAAMIGFSGAYLPPEIVRNNGTPICLIHGKNDEVVAFSALENAATRLKQIGVSIVETHAVNNLGHSIDLSGLKFATEFLKKHVR